MSERRCEKCGGRLQYERAGFRWSYERSRDPIPICIVRYRCNGCGQTHALAFDEREGTAEW